MHVITAVRQRFLAHPWLYGGALAIIAAGGAFAAMRGQDDTPSTELVRRGDVFQVVSVTGKVKPASEVTLSFERSGRIAGVNRSVGDRVGAGALLVSLEAGDLAAQAEQARAALRKEEIELEDIKKGTTAEDIRVSEVALQNALSSAQEALRSAYVNADDAIRNKVDQFMSNPRTGSPKLNFTVTDPQLRIDVEGGRASVEQTLARWGDTVLRGIPIGSTETALFDAHKDLSDIQAFLDKVSIAVNTLTPNSTLSQTTIDAYKAAVISGRSNVSTSLSNVSTSQEEIRTAQSNLALKRAPATAEEIAAQIADIDAAKAHVSNLEAQLGKTVIRAPINGIVTKMDAKRGEIATAGAALVSVISDAKYEIEAFVPEADIAKFKIGSSATTTLDAYPEVEFIAMVVRIDPAETVVDGVATYKTTLQFRQNDARVKSGMTANTDIEGERRTNVLVIPARAIREKDGRKTVTVPALDATSEREIETGLRGTSGDIEVLSGLEEGETVLLD